jgi:large repetitive protein
MLNWLRFLLLGLMLANAGTLAGQTLSLGPDTLHCNSDPLVLDAGPGYLSYQWSNGSNAQSIIATQTRLYWVEVTDSQSVLHRDSINVTLKETPNAAFVVDNVCFGTASPADDRSTYITDTIVGWFWDFGDGNTATTQFPANLYDTVGIKNITLVVYTNFGCTDTATGFAEVFAPPFVNAGVDDSINVGDTAIVVGSVFVSDYSWSPTGSILDPQQLNITVFPSITTVYALTAVDTIGCTASDEVIVYVNQYPIANNDQGNTPSGSSISLNVLNNDADPNDDPLTVTITSGPAYGSATVDSSGIVIYTPSGTFNGRDTIFYTACDNFNPQLCDDAFVVIIVTNAMPTAGNDEATIDANTNVTIDLIVNDNDPNTDQTIFVSSISPAANGAIVDQGDGTILYTPNSGFFGVDSFSYVICDNGSPIQCATGWVYVTILESPLEVPNSFSPNGDGVLDTWFIRGLNVYTSNHLVIFTKWGEVVLDIDNYNNDWKGIRGFNEELPEGIYYYKLTLEGAETLTGYIMLKR